MSEIVNSQVDEQSMYGFESDDVKQTTMHFGGNFGHSFMTKFEYITKAGKKGDDGQPTDAEALDIVININGTDKSFRQFPVTKAFDENNTEITDPKHPAFIKAMTNLNQICVMIMKCYRDENDVKAALAKRISSFKDFAAILVGLLPKDFATKPLDVFLQWQYQITNENDKTYLEFPKKIQQGKFICAAVAPINGEWKMVKTEEDGFYYEDGTKNKHPFFSRSKYFMDSNWFKQQKEGGSETSNALNNTNTNTGNTAASPGANW